MKKRILSALLTACLVISLLPCNVLAFTSFSDIPDDYSKPALEAAVANGLLNGTDGKISPNDNLTRAQMAAIISRAFGATQQASLAGFTDVSASAWHFADMGKAVQMKVLNGDSGLLKPDAAITRQEAFTVLARALKLKEGTASNIASFTDCANVSSWAVGSTAAMVTNGYIHGADSKINPQNNISRKDFAVMMDNIVKNYIKTAGVVTSVNEGSVMINVPDVTLQNVTIKGNLIIGDGVGNGTVTLDNVKVEGNTIVRGGGTNSFVVKGNSTLGTVTVAKVDGNIRVSVEGSASVEVVEINDGKNDVLIEGNIAKLNISAPEVPVTIQNATVKEVAVTGDKANVTVAKSAKVTTISTEAANTKLNVAGAVETITSAKTAEGAKIEVSKGASVGTINAAAAKTEISGEGSVKNANVTGNDVKVNTAGTQLKVDAGVTGTQSGGKDVKSGTSTVTEGQTPSSGGGGGGGGYAPPVSPTKVTIDSSWLAPNTIGKEVCVGISTGNVLMGLYTIADIVDYYGIALDEATKAPTGKLTLKGKLFNYTGTNGGADPKTACVPLYVKLSEFGGYKVTSVKYNNVSGSIAYDDEKNPTKLCINIPVAENMAAKPSEAKVKDWRLLDSRVTIVTITAKDSSGNEKTFSLTASISERLVNISTVSLTDNSTSGKIDPVIEAYSVSGTRLSGNNYVDVSISGKNLQYHKNYEGNMGFWVGFAVKAPENAVKFKYAADTAQDRLVLSDKAYDNETIESGNNGVSFYTDLSATEPKTWYKVQWLNANNEVIGSEAYFMNTKAVSLLVANNRVLDKDVTLNNKLYISKDAVLTISEGKVLTNATNNLIVNDGTINVNGTLDNYQYVDTKGTINLGTTGAINNKTENFSGIISDMAVVDLGNNVEGLLCKQSDKMYYLKLSNKKGSNGEALPIPNGVPMSDSGEALENLYFNANAADGLRTQEQMNNTLRTKAKVASYTAIAINFSTFKKLFGKSLVSDDVSYAGMQYNSPYLAAYNIDGKETDGPNNTDQIFKTTDSKTGATVWCKRLNSDTANGTAGSKINAIDGLSILVGAGDNAVIAFVDKNNNQVNILIDARLLKFKEPSKDFAFIATPGCLTYDTNDSYYTYQGIVNGEVKIITSLCGNINLSNPKAGTSEKISELSAGKLYAIKAMNSSNRVTDVEELADDSSNLIKAFATGTNENINKFLISGNTILCIRTVSGNDSTVCSFNVTNDCQYFVVDSESNAINCVTLDDIKTLSGDTYAVQGIKTSGGNSDLSHVFITIKRKK